jgi:PAS domain S-box-containing protein
MLNDEKKAVPIRAHTYIRMDGTPVDVEVNAVPYNYQGQDGALVFVRDITERKRAENALQHQFDFLQQMINAIPAPIFIKNPQGVYTGCNKAFEAFKGLRREDIVGKTPSDISPQHLAHLYLEKDRELYRLEKPQIYEGQSVDADGEIRDILFHKAKLSCADGGIDGMVGVMLDITERKKTEALLLESQKRYRLVADFTYDWEYWLDPSGAFQYVSPSCERVSGYPPSFFLNDPQALLHIVYPEDREKFRSHIRTSNRTDCKPCELEFRIIRKDGSLRWINHVCTSVSTDDGAFVGRRGSNRDVTEQRLAQETVRESEARFRTAFENAAVGMALVDSDGVYLEANAAMAAMIGYETTELMGRKVADFTHPEDLERRSRFIQDLLEGKLISGEHERRFMHRNGSVVYTLLWATVQRDEKGRFQYFISLIQNITKRVLAQQD